MANVNEASYEKYDDLISYVCKECDSTFIAQNKKEDACIYCGSKKINLTKTKILQNAMIIPFTVNIESIKKIYKKKVRFNFLIPFKFKKKEFINSIKRIYIPAYLLDANYKGKLDFIAGDKTKISKGLNRLIELKKYFVKLDLNMDYEKVLINAYSKITESEFKQIYDYNFEALKELDKDFFKESYIINPNISSDDVLNIVQDNITNNSLKLARNKINHQLKKIEKNNTNFALETAKQVFLPVYFINLKYREKDYHFLVNGTNNKMYYKFPMGILETIISSLLIEIVLFALVYFLATII